MKIKTGITNLNSVILIAYKHLVGYNVFYWRYIPKKIIPNNL